MSRYDDFKEGLLQAPFVSKLRQSLIDSLSIVKWKNSIKEIDVKFVDDSACYTDGCDIYLGKYFPFFNWKERSVRENIFMMQGVIFHEVGHLLYSSFTSMEAAGKHFYNGRFWPWAPKNESSAISYIQSGEKEAARAFTAYRTILNCIEDGRIENLMFKQQGTYGRFVTGLRLMRDIQRGETKSFSELMAEYDNANESTKPMVKMQIMFDLVLQISKFGFVKDATFEDYKDNPFLLKVLEIEDYVMEALDSVSAEKLFTNVNEVYSLIFDEFLLPFFDSIPDNDESELSDGGNSDGAPNGTKTSNSVKEALEKISQAMGGSHRQTKKGGKKAEKSTEESRNKSKDAAEKEAAEAKEAAEKEAEGAGGSSEKESEASADNGGTVPDSDESENEEAEANAGGNPSNTEYTEKENAGPTRIPRKETNSIWGGYGEATILTEKDMEVIEGLDVDAINSIKTDAEEAAPIDTSLKEPTGLDYGEYHKNLTWRIERVLLGKTPISSLQDAYNSFEKYIETGKEAARLIKPFINPETEHIWEKNQFYGTRFKASRVANPNLRYFNKRATITRTPSLSVAILVDESGSMSGGKIKVAKATAIALYEMCVELGVPYCVIGHSTRYYDEDVYIRNYCYFDEHEEDTKYRLLSIDCGGCNRDGAALRYTAELLKNQQSDRKLLLIISDGQPNANNYGGTAAEADIKDALKEYERFGVSVIAAAIDADKEQIKNIYGGERFLRIDDIETLPDELLSIVKKALF